MISLTNEWTAPPLEATMTETAQPLATVELNHFTLTDAGNAERVFAYGGSNFHHVA